MQSITTDSVLLASTLLAGLVFFMLHHKYQLKPIIFYGFSAVTLVTTTVLLISTVLLQATSDSAGVAHSQAEIEFWVCDTEIKPNTASLSSNRKFTQDDKRITVSGFVKNASTSVSLGPYFHAIGGELQEESIMIPLENDPSTWLASQKWIDGDPQGNMDIAFIEKYMLRNDDHASVLLIDITDGQRCPDSSNTELQVFVYTADSQTRTYQQQKLANPAEYMLTRGQSIPPGDCIIVEFSQPKDTTDKLCPSYGLRDNLRCTAFGASRIYDQLCSYQEVRQPEQSS